MELVGVGVGVLGGSQFVDLARSNFKVLVRSELLLLGLLGSNGSRVLSGLLSLLLGNLSSLLTLLELRLGDLLTSHLIEVGLLQLFSDLFNRLVGHCCKMGFLGVCDVDRMSQSKKIKRLQDKNQKMKIFTPKDQVRITLNL